MLKSLKKLGLGLLVSLPIVAHASSDTLYFTNSTSHQSMAGINGTMLSDNATPAGETNVLSMYLLMIACAQAQGFDYATNTCTADIYAETDSDNPIDVGTLTIDTTTGDINPKKISNGGYSVIVTDAGVAELVKD